MAGLGLVFLPLLWRPSRSWDKPSGRGPQGRQWPSPAPGKWPARSCISSRWCCALVIALGMGLGSFRIAGLSLGTSGVLFSALLFGHFGQQEGWAMPEMVGKNPAGVLFVYAVGLGAQDPPFSERFATKANSSLLRGRDGGHWRDHCVGRRAIADSRGELATGIFGGADQHPCFSGRPASGCRRRAGRASPSRSVTAWPTRWV